MGILGMILMAVGFIICFVGGIWCLVLAFKESVLWGLGYIFIPFVSLVFVFMHWDKTKKPFLITLAGAVLAIVGILMGGKLGIPS